MISVRQSVDEQIVYKNRAKCIRVFQIGHGSEIAAQNVPFLIITINKEGIPYVKTLIFVELSYLV